MTQKILIEETLSELETLIDEISSIACEISALEKKRKEKLTILLSIPVKLRLLTQTNGA